MSQERNWMYHNLDEHGNINEEFGRGAYYFVEFVFSQTSGFRAKCPCKECRLTQCVIREEMKVHLWLHGFMPNYHLYMSVHSRRSYHGVGKSVSRNIGNDVNVGSHSKMVAGASTSKFVGDDHDDIAEEPNGFAKEFYQFLRVSLSPTSRGIGMTALKWVSQHISNRVLHNICAEGFDKFVSLMLMWLTPEDKHKLPDSLDNMKTMMKRLGIGYETFDVCVNNCFLYKGEENNSYTACPICNEPRYESRKTRRGSKTTISRKKLWYFPVSSRLQRLYMSPNTGQHMTWHLKCREEKEKIVHPACAEAWKHFDRTHPSFAAEPRNVRLGLCTYSFTPLGTSSVSNSCWLVFVTPYNLPPHLCMRQEYIFLSLIISGTTSPEKNIDVLLRPLIDELRMLWDSGIETFDSFRQQNFMMRASVLWTISDYSGYDMMSQWSTHGWLSCPYCMESTKAFPLKHGQKISFFDCHRQFLPEDHPFRRNKKDFLKNRVEIDSPPKRRSGANMLEIVQRSNIQQYGFGLRHNWTRTSIFWELPYWTTNLIRHNLDAMHCEKNFFADVKNIVMDDPKKSKDNNNARKDLELLTRRKSLFLKIDELGRVFKPKAMYCLNRDQRKHVCEWLKELRLPDGYTSNISRCVQLEQLQLVGMKSHDYHVFMQRLLPIAFRDMLPDNVWGPLVEVSYFFRALFATELLISNMVLLEQSIVETMCKLEKIFPPALFGLMEHLTIHLPYEAKVGGPVQYRWTYPFKMRMHEIERTVKRTLKRNERCVEENKKGVEESICEAYLLSELTYFRSHYFKVADETRNEVAIASNIVGQLSIFQSKGRPLGSVMNTRSLTVAEGNAAEYYILLNCKEVDHWLRLFQEQMCQNLDESQIQQKRSKEFPSWFKQQILSGQYKVDPRLVALALGPRLKARTYEGYIVNGFIFHTEAYGKLRNTMNSGVCVKANVGDPCQMSLYGVLQEILELDYWGSGYQQTIVLFKCDWFDIGTGMTVHPTYHLVDINPQSRLSTNEPFICPTQAQQVYYTRYPSQQNPRRSCLTVLSVKPRDITDSSSITHENEVVQVEAPDQDKTPPIDKLVVDLNSYNAPEIYQDKEPPIIRLVVDLNSYNLPLQLADEELVFVGNVNDEEGVQEDEVFDGEETEEEDYIDSDDDSENISSDTSSN